MADSETSHLDLTPIFERFPMDRERIQHLMAASETFQAICEDYTLARTTLDQLAHTDPTWQRAKEIAEYESLIADLEDELAGAICDPMGEC